MATSKNNSFSIIIYCICHHFFKFSYSTLHHPKSCYHIVWTFFYLKLLYEMILRGREYIEVSLNAQWVHVICIYVGLCFVQPIYIRVFWFCFLIHSPHDSSFLVMLIWGGNQDGSNDWSPVVQKEDLDYVLGLLVFEEWRVGRFFPFPSLCTVPPPPLMQIKFFRSKY